MGYMGFGLQKWIYTLKPRRPFSKRRIPVSDTIDSTAYAKDTLNIEGRRNPHVEDIDNELEEIKERISKRKKTGIINGTFLIIALLVFLTLIYFKMKEYREKVEPLKKYQSIYEKEVETENAYKMILEYGNEFLKKKDYENALNEFKQAVKMFPEKNEGFVALAKAYYFACLDLNTDCDKAIQEYSSLIKKFPENKEFIKKRAEIYMHLGEFEKADSDLNKLKDN